MKFLLVVFCLFGGLFQAYAQQVVKLKKSVVDTAAMTFAKGDKTRFSTHVNGRTHQQTPIVTHRGYQYLIYYNANRHVCVGRRPLQSEQWDIIEFEDYVFKSCDSHNTAVIGICEGDGTIHLAFDHHVSELHYRVSALGAANHPDEVEWSAALFGPVTDRLGSVGPINKLTYPRFFNAPNGNLMFYYRYVTSGNGDSTLQEYDAQTHDWTLGLGRFVARDIGEYTRDGETSIYRCAYMNNLTFSGTRLHASWVWRDRFKKTSAANQHDICYSYSDDYGRTWRNNVGSVIGETGSSEVIHLDTRGLIVAPVDCGYRLTNQNGHYAYPDGSIHVMVLQSLRKGERPVYWHYWRNAKGQWNHEVLPFSGGRPKIRGDRDGSLFLFYEAQNHFQIAKGTPNRTATKWKWEPIFKEKSVKIGSEAVVDFTRWEKERVISAYMQANPEEFLSYGSGEVIEGKPSALMVIDYQISAYTANPVPAMDAVNVSGDTLLKWNAGIRSKASRLYIGRDAKKIATAKITSKQYVGEFTETEFKFPKSLNGGDTFYWRVDAVRGNNTVLRGSLWSFTTAK